MTRFLLRSSAALATASLWIVGTVFFAIGIVGFYIAGADYTTWPVVAWALLSYAVFAPLTKGLALWLTLEVLVATLGADE